MAIFFKFFIYGSLVSYCFANGLIGIFSSPANFVQRHVIRQTWVKQMKRSNGISYKFVVGNQLCPIPPERRMNIYECRENLITQINSTFSTINYLNQKRASQCANGFGFLSNQNFVVTHIGIINKFIDLYEFPVRVKLKEASTGRQLSSVTFYDKNTTVKAIRPVYFPRGSEAALLIENGQTKFCFVFSIYNSSYEVITVTSFIKRNLVVPVEPHYGLSIYFDGRIVDSNIANITNHWDVLWAEENLQMEYQRFDDILFVNVTDVYRNLPIKLIRFLEVVNKHNVSYVIKTDDDSMLDIQRIEAALKHGSSSPMWWWSSFKEFWAVPRFGKWRENAYKSITYPPFPCGGGYVLSKPVVEYIVGVKDHLKIFQGEDVSMGVWLSGLNLDTYYPDNDLFQAFNYRAILSGVCEDSCTWTCDSGPSYKPKCNLVQLNPLRLSRKWNEFLNKGHI